MARFAVTMSADERFATKWVADPMTGCHLWLGSRRRGGYGKFRIEKRFVGAHAFAYERKHGPVPPGLVLDHFVCNTPRCCNPDHVRPTTSADNIARGQSPTARNARKTHCNHGHELTPENTYRHPKRGSRHCMACQRDRDSRRAPRVR